MLGLAVDPGLLPTKVGGAGALDDLEMGHLTQTRLAASDAGTAEVSGGYWYHRQQREAAPEVSDPGSQEALVETLAELTGGPFVRRAPVRRKSGTAG
ncbi:hypothetical protein ACVIKP_002751 [Rhizobium leguminosarum]